MITAFYLMVIIQSVPRRRWIINSWRPVTMVSTVMLLVRYLTQFSFLSTFHEHRYYFVAILFGVEKFERKKKNDFFQTSFRIFFFSGDFFFFFCLSLGCYTSFLQRNRCQAFFFASLNITLQLFRAKIMLPGYLFLLFPTVMMTVYIA